MDKLKLTTPDIVQSNIEKLEKLFPECIVEIVDEENSSANNLKYKKGVNTELLLQLLSDSALDQEQSYGFSWVGKNQAIVDANTPSNMTLRPKIEKSIEWDKTQNVYIEGDNLEVLKLLQKGYLNSVKLIYIDPPYNTGQDFVYPDSFSMTDNEYGDETPYLDENGNINYKKPNTATSARYHSRWCSMIYSRLSLAKNLIAKDGVIMISVDDNEVNNLKSICNEIFGESNFVAQFVIASNSSKNNAKYVSINHEYILCYARNLDKLGDSWRVKKNYVDEYVKRANAVYKMDLTDEEKHQELLSLVKYPRFYDFDHYTYVDERGVFRSDNPGGVSNGNKITEIIHPITKKPCAKPSGGWRYKDEEIKRKLANNEFMFGADETIIPTPKRYLDDYIYQIPKSITFFDSQGSTKWMKKNGIPFSFPKSVDLMKHFISIFPSDALVLDFFSGSATTAHAVMKLNQEDGGNRRFILVQVPEPVDPKSEAGKKGFNTICDIGEQRLIKARDEINSQHGSLIHSDLDTGFRVFSLDETNMKDVYFHPNELKQGELFDYESNVKEDRTDLDLLFECILDLGLPLTYSYSHENINGNSIYFYNDGDLVACFDPNLSEETVTEIARRKPQLAVFRDSCFADAPGKINVYEIFKRYIPEDAGNIDRRVKVI